MLRKHLSRWFFFLFWIAVPLSLWGQTAQWIWLPTNRAPGVGPEIAYFRKTFRTPPLLWNSRLTLSADDSAEVFLNGVSVATCESWKKPVRAEVTVRLNQGENVVAIRGQHRSGAGGLMVHLSLGGSTNVVSDSSWLVSTNEEAGWASLRFNADHWFPAQSLGPYGMLPWGDVFRQAAATPAESLNVPPGFEVNLLRSAEATEGSWICLTFDDQGRLIVSPEGDQRPLLRFTLSHDKIAKVESLEMPIHYAMGLVYARGSLFANAHGPAGAGVYKLTDANRNDQFEASEIQLLKKFEGGSEHGYHALRIGPDDKLYVVNGNGTKLPEGLSPFSPYRDFAQDIVSVNPDETTEAGHESAAQGYFLRGDLDGRNWELWAGGMRNVYAFDFSPDGDLFAFDSDMEWDWGTPWYRPTRIIQVIPGAEFGWRDGTRTWPDAYEDSLAPVLNIGIGSPTGVRFGSKSNFPEKYRQALFAMDWSYGRILTIHLAPNGASYNATSEPFLKGSTLNLTDLAFGPDGNLYFITGGRATQSGLYQVKFNGSTQSEAASKANLTTNQSSNAAVARKLRRELESFQGRQDPNSINFIWPYLNSEERVTRFAARVALESQNISQWKERALRETNGTAGLTALLALARLGGKEPQEGLFEALGRFPFGSLNESQAALKLRVIEVSLSRNGKPGRDSTQTLQNELLRQYPASNWPLNRELSRVLLFLDAPNVVPKTLDLLFEAKTQQEQLHYVAQLRNVKSGWSLSDRRRLLGWWLEPRDHLSIPAELVSWFADVGRNYVDGAWLDRYLREFRTDFISTFSAEERKELRDLINKPFQKARLVPTSNRSFVREWTMAELLPDLEESTAGRNVARGRQAFVDSQCIACHRFGNDGGSVGPELTSAANKYDRRSLLESILEPSKVIAETYRNTSIYLKNGDSFTGRILQENGEQTVLETDPLTGARETIAHDQIDRVAPALLSPMPEGLVNSLSREEILDLLAYLQFGATNVVTQTRSEPR